MAAGWVHATMDLMAFGRPYFDLHKLKDRPWEDLGWDHRKLNHEWYQDYGRVWDLKNPFPPIVQERTDLILDDEEAEKFQSLVSHDYLDRVWDTLSKEHRKWWEDACRYALENPEILLNTYEVDVVNGLIYRVIDDKPVIEECPELIHEYQRLMAYIAKVPQE